MKQNPIPAEWIAAQPIRFILCDTTADAGQSSSCNGELTTSPTTCLSRAIDEKPEVIVVRIGKVTIPMREALVELCWALKHNTFTYAIPILVLLHAKHRRLLEKLHRAGVDFVEYGDPASVDPEKVRRIVSGDLPENRLAVQILRLCQFLNYREIDARHEMTVCGAHQNRLVLGGQRLQELCHTTDYRHCAYYLKPRVVA